MPRLSRLDKAWLEGYRTGFMDSQRRPESEFIGRFSPSEAIAVAERGFTGRAEKKLRQRPRRKTAYQSAYSAAYKRLKKKHPRMAFGSLSKKAHAAARKKVK